MWKLPDKYTVCTQPETPAAIYASLVTISGSGKAESDWGLP